MNKKELSEKLVKLFKPILTKPIECEDMIITKVNWENNFDDDSNILDINVSINFKALLK